MGPPVSSSRAPLPGPSLYVRAVAHGRSVLWLLAPVLEWSEGQVSQETGLLSGLEMTQTQQLQQVYFVQSIKKDRIRLHARFL